MHERPEDRRSESDGGSNAGRADEDEASSAEEPRATASAGRRSGRPAEGVPGREAPDVAAEPSVPEGAHVAHGDARGPGGAHRAYSRRARADATRRWWRAFKRSPFYPATVLLFILAAAAGLFAGSYTYAMANPTPHDVRVAIVGGSDGSNGKAFVAGMEKALGASLELRTLDSYQQAREAVEDQRVFAILSVKRAGSVVELDVSGASGASVAQLLQQAAPTVGKNVGVPVRVKDVNPLQKGDPRGLAMFYISLAAVIVGFVGAIQLSVHARALNPAERIAFTAGYALMGSLAIVAAADWLLGALQLPFPESWLILALTMFTSGMVFTMFNTLFGRWAMLPTWGLMVLLGNPSSGGAVSWPLLPSTLGYLGQWLPPGASVNAQHTAVYFSHHQHALPFLVLSAWACVACVVFWLWRHRHPGGRVVGAYSSAPTADVSGVPGGRAVGGGAAG